MAEGRVAHHRDWAGATVPQPGAAVHASDPPLHQQRYFQQIMSAV